MYNISKIVEAVSKKSRKRRACIFCKSFKINKNTKILDLGSENGSNINNVLKGCKIQPENVYIADINESLIEEGKNLFGYTPVLIGETGSLPFSDEYFDIVYCSSVIEHVTVPKKEAWTTISMNKFRSISLKRQKEFAREIKRLGKCYFIQTPYKHFPIETHSWLPFLAWMPRWLQISILHISNLIWVKKTSPDWYLLNKRELSEMFSEADILEEKMLFFTKSIIAILRDKPWENNGM